MEWRRTSSELGERYGWVGGGRCDLRLFRGYMGGITVTATGGAEPFCCCSGGHCTGSAANGCHDFSTMKSF